MSSELERTTWLSKPQSQGRLPAAEGSTRGRSPFCGLSGSLYLLSPPLPLLPLGGCSRSQLLHTQIFLTSSPEAFMVGLSHFCTKIILWFKWLVSFLAAYPPQVYLQAVILSLIRLCFASLNKPNFPEIGLLFLPALPYTCSQFS